MPQRRLSRVLAAAALLTTSLASHAFAGPCAPPLVTSVSPSVVPAAGGIHLTIYGTDFTTGGSPKVDVGLRPVQILSATNTQLVVVAPPQDDDATPAVRVKKGGRAGNLHVNDLTITRITYAPPVVDPAPTALVTRGGVLITVTGRDFRCSAPRAYVENPATGGTCPASVVSLTDTTIVVRTEDCDDGSLGNDERVLHVTFARDGVIHRDLATRNLLLSGSRVTGVIPAYTRSSGGETITIVGSGFDAGTGAPPRPQVCVDGRCADVRVSTWSNTSIVGVAPPAAVTPPAVGTPAVVTGKVRVRTGDVIGSSASLEYHSAPVLTSVRASSLPSLGGYPLTVRGQNFGPDLHLFIAAGPGPGEFVPASSVSSSEAVFPLPVLPPGAAELTLSQGFNSSPVSTTVLAPPTVNGAGGSGGTVLGGDVITVVGSHFGPNVALHDVQVEVKQGGTKTSCGPIRWSAPEVLVCRVPAGVAGPADVIVTVNGVSATRTNALTYSAAGTGTAPVLSGMFPTTAARTGGTVITLSGSNFGAGSLVRYGQSLITPTTVVQGSLTFTSTAFDDGVDQMAIEVVRGTKASNPFFNEAANLGLTPISGGQHASWSGGVHLTVTGSNFTSQSFVRCVSSTSESHDVVPTSVTAGQLVFVAPEFQPGGTVSMQVIDRTTSSSSIALPYDGPGLTGITGAEVSPSGGTVITINGSGFGVARGKVGFQNGDIPTQDWSDTQITAAVPPRLAGCPSSRPVRVTTAAGEGSNGAGVTYLPPTVDGLDSPSASSLGGYPLTVRGSNFGPDAHLVWADGLPGPDLAVLDRCETSFAILLGEGSAGDRLVSLDTDSDPAPVAMGLALLSPPSVGGLSPAAGPLQGGNLVTLMGQHFGAPGTQRSIRFAGDDDCPFTVVEEHPDFLTCLVPPGTSHGMRDLVLEVEGVADTLPNAYEFSATTGVGGGAVAPRALALAPLRSPFAGELTLRLSLPQAGRWQLKLYDARGALVQRFEGDAPAGALDVRWNGRSSDGRAAAPGVYFARLTSAQGTRDARVVKLQ